jgi:hypothetical protein
MTSCYRGRGQDPRPRSSLLLAWLFKGQIARLDTSSSNHKHSGVVGRMSPTSEKQLPLLWMNKPCFSCLPVSFTCHPFEIHLKLHRHVAIGLESNESLFQPCHDNKQASCHFSTRHEGTGHTRISILDSLSSYPASNTEVGDAPRPLRIKPPTEIMCLSVCHKPSIIAVQQDHDPRINLARAEARSPSRLVDSSHIVKQRRTYWGEISKSHPGPCRNEI